MSLLELTDDRFGALDDAGQMLTQAHRLIKQAAAILAEHDLADLFATPDFGVTLGGLVGLSAYTVHNAANAAAGLILGAERVEAHE